MTTRSCGAKAGKGSKVASTAAREERAPASRARNYFPNPFGGKSEVVEVMAGLSVEHLPFLLNLCALDHDARVAALRENVSYYRQLVSSYASRDSQLLFRKLSTIHTVNGRLIRESNVVLPVELWKFASNYAGAAIGLSQALGRRISAESVQAYLSSAKFDVHGSKLGTLTLTAIKGFIHHEVSDDVAEAARLVRASEFQEPDDNATSK